MPKTKKNGGGKTRSNDSIVEHFHGLATVALVAGANNLAFNPAVTTRLASIGDAYQLYRLVRLRFRLQLPDSAPTAAQAAAWATGIVDTPPTTAAQAMEIVNSCYLSIRSTVPSQWVEVPPTDLRGPFPWYKTVQGTPDTSEEIVGYVFLTGSGTNSVLLEFEGDMQFKEGIAPANTPAAVELRRRLREEQAQRLVAKERANVLALISNSTLAPSAATSTGRGATT